MSDVMYLDTMCKWHGMSIVLRAVDTKGLRDTEIRDHIRKQFAKWLRETGCVEVPCRGGVPE